MDTNFGINFTGQTKSLTKSLDSVSNSMNRVATAGRSVSGNFKNFQKQTRKLNDSFVNMNRDGNRSAKVFGNMSLGAIKLSSALKGVIGIGISNYLANATISAMDFIETTHLFNVSMGELAEETGELIDKMHEYTTLDVGNLRNRIGTFNLLGKTMGFTAKNAQALAIGANNLSMDMGALFNVPYQQIAEDLRSGLIGQSRTLYKYGIDVTEAAIANEALAQGISKSVRHMTQGEKMMLRYSVIVKQMGTLHGDFAKTFNEPANQLRILKENFATLSRSIGQLFVPVMKVVIKWTRAVVLTLTRLAELIASFFGIKIPAPKNLADSLDGVKDDSEEIDDNLNSGLKKANKKAKELRKQLAGFDELNIINIKPPESGGSGGAGGAGGIGGGSPLDLDLDLYDALFDKIEDKAKKLSEDISNYFKKIWDYAEPTRVAITKLWNEGLSKMANFTWGTIQDFYNSFLIPMGKWTLGEGLPRFFNITNDLLNEINWDVLREKLNAIYEALVPFGKAIGSGLLDFYENTLKPLGVWVANSVLPTFLDKLKDTIEFLTDVFEKHGEKIFNLIFLFTSLKTIVGLVSNVSGIFNGVLGFLGVLFSSLQNLIGILLDKLFLFFTSTKLGTGILQGLSNVVGGKVMVAMGLFLGIIILLIKIIADLWKENEQFRTTVITAWDNVKNVLKNAWESVLKPVLVTFKNFVLEVYEHGFKPLYQGIKDVVREVILLILDLWNGIYPYLQKIINQISIYLIPIIKLISGTFSIVISTSLSILGTFLSTVGSIINNVKGIFQGLITMIRGIFTGDWRAILNGAVTIMKNIFSGIGNIVKYPINAIISALNGAIRGMNKIKIPNWVPGVGGKGINIPQIPRLADGGELNMGQMFIAREAGAELVGNFGNKTGVVNNDDIVRSITQGVYEATKSANSGNQNNSGQPIVINIGEDTLLDKIIDGLNRQNVIDGKIVIEL